MLFLEAYMDESYDGAKEKAFVVAGYMAPSRVWARVWHRWSEALRQESLGEFHMVDCVHGGGEFSDIEPPERERIARKFVDIIVTSHGLVGSVSAINLEHYSEFLPRLKELRRIPPGLPVSGNLKDPYFLAFQHAVEVMATWPWVQDLHPEEEIEFVFEQNESSGRAESMHASLKRSKLDYASRVGAITFAGKERIPLQVADVLAYESCRYLTRCVLGDEPERLEHRFLVSVLPSFNIRILNRDGIAEVVRALEEQAAKRVQ